MKLKSGVGGLSPTKYAKEKEVDRSTVYRWIKKGLLDYYETPSGLKRIVGVSNK